MKNQIKFKKHGFMPLNLKENKQENSCTINTIIVFEMKGLGFLIAYSIETYSFLRQMMIQFMEANF